jgi:hypothetical protein
MCQHFLVFFWSLSMKLFTKSAIVLSSVLGAVAANAAAPDFSTLTSSVDFATVVTAVLAIAGLIAAVFVAVRGAKMVLGMIRG